MTLRRRHTIQEAITPIYQSKKYDIVPIHSWFPDEKLREGHFGITLFSLPKNLRHETCELYQKRLLYERYANLIQLHCGQASIRVCRWKTVHA